MVVREGCSGLSYILWQREQWAYPMSLLVVTEITKCAFGDFPSAKCAFGGIALLMAERTMGPCHGVCDQIGCGGLSIWPSTRCRIWL